MFIVGAGATALELAHIFSTLGTKVYVAEKSSRILSTFDPEVSALVTNDAKNRNISILDRKSVGRERVCQYV